MVSLVFSRWREVTFFDKFQEWRSNKVFPYTAYVGSSKKKSLTPLGRNNQWERRV